MESTIADVILEAATIEFARTGLAGARMARIARQARVSTATLHYHFTSKRHLYDAALERAAETLRAQLAAVAGECRSSRASLDIIADIGARYPAVARLLIHDLLSAGRSRGSCRPLRETLRETAVGLKASPIFQRHGATERDIVMIELTIAGWLLAGAVDGRREWLGAGEGSPSNRTSSKDPGDRTR